MHKTISKKKQKLSLVQADDNYLTKNEKFKFHDQCKNTTRQKINAVNLGMLNF